MRITVGHLIAFVALLGIGVTAAFLLRSSNGGTKRELAKTQVGSISTTPAEEGKTQVGSISTTSAEGVDQLTVQERTQVGSISTNSAEGVDELTVQEKTQVGSTTNTPAVGVYELTVQATSPGNPDCEGIFQAGQEVRYSGGGFTPGTSVRLFFTSPGLGSSDELEVAELAADENGDIAGTVRIPLGATGFIKDGASYGLAFFHALGLGSAANHLDDIAMIGLAPDTSSCGPG